MQQACSIYVDIQVSAQAPWVSTLPATLPAHTRHTRPAREVTGHHHKCQHARQLKQTPISTHPLTGPLEKKTPSGFILSTSDAGQLAGTTVMRQPKDARRRRILYLMPKS